MTRNPSDQAKGNVVILPLFGETVADWRQRARDAGLDPASPLGVFAGMIETPEPAWEAIVTFDGDIATGVEIHSLRGEPLTRAVWDRVRMAEVIAEAAAMVAWLAPVRKSSGTAPSLGARRSPGRPRDHDDDHYRGVADAYNNAVAQGSRQPRRAVAKALEREFPGITDKDDHRVRAWIDKAQALGFITDRGRKPRQ
jgi:hypothetical protein